MPRKGQKIDLSEKEWEKIKTEYITSDISYRSLADKYGMTYTRLHTRAYEENWKEEREQFKGNLVKKSVDLICDEQAEQIARAIRIGNTMLEKIEESLNEIDMVLCKNTQSTRGVEEIDGHLCEVTRSTEDFTKKRVAIDRAGLKQLSAVLRDLREIGIFRCALDQKEQEARINKLRKDAEDDTGANDVKVIIEDDDGFSE